MPDILTQLTQLAALQQEHAALLQRQQTALPAYLKVRLAKIDAAYSPALTTLTAQIALATQQVKAAVIDHGASVKGKELHAVYVPGRLLWDNDMLAGYAVNAPEVLLCCTLGAPSVTVRAVKETP
jgi:hypothetical protein